MVCALRLVGLLALCAAGSGVDAAALRVQVTDAQGRAVQDAVVSLQPTSLQPVSSQSPSQRARRPRPMPQSPSQMADASPAGARDAAPRPPPVTRVIDQVDETFVPYVEVFRPGDSVVFRNSDTTRHHVYSFAPASAFELVLAPGESSAPMPLGHSGTIAVGCNIHDRMITHLYVADVPWLARSDAAGEARIDGVPAGGYRLRLWHPQLRRPGDAPDRAVTIADGAPVHAMAVTLPLLPDPRGSRDRERVEY